MIMRLAGVILFGFLCMASADDEAGALQVRFVRVQQFDAADVGDGVRVYWSTTFESGIHGFRLFRCEEGRPSFSVTSDPVWVCGNEEGGQYAVTDSSAPVGVALTYELWQVAPGMADCRVAQVMHARQRVRSLTSADAKPLPSLAATASPSVTVPSPLVAWVGTGPRVRAWGDSTPADRVRLGVRAEGIYRVTAQEIADAMDVSRTTVSNAFASGGFLLSNQGVPVAWQCAGDVLYFYGLPAGSRYAPENVYWLSPGTGVAVAPVQPPSFGVLGTNTSFVSMQSVQGTTYSNRYLFTSLVDPPLLGRQLVNNGESPAWPQTLIDPAAGAWQGRVRMGLLSYYQDEGGTDEHACRVYAGGALVGTTNWTGEQYVQHQFDFSSSNVSSGNLGLQINNVGSGLNSRFLIVGLDLSYARQYVARNGLLLCTGGPSNTIAVANLPDAGVAVWDVTAPTQPASVTSVVVTAQADGTWTAAFACGGISNRYAVFSYEAGTCEPSVRGVRDVDWSSSANSADYAILIPPEAWLTGFRSAVQPLADFRAAQGLRTRVIDVESIYNRFSHGLVSPQAIKDFVGAGYTNWTDRTLRYVLLAGMGNVDFKQEVNTVSVLQHTACLIPFFIGGQRFEPSHEGMIVVRDHAFGDFFGGPAPEVAIGRIPTVKTQELARVVAKTIAYEGAQTWKQQASVCADWNNTGDKYYDFTAAANRVAHSLALAGWNVVKHYPLLYDSSAPNDRPAYLRDDWNLSLLPAMRDTGSGILYYIGHSALYSLGYAPSSPLLGCYPGQLDDVKSTNWRLPPVAVFIGCQLNRWHLLTTTRNLATYGVLADGTGFAAAIAANGFVLPTDGDALGERFFALAQQHGTVRLGDALREALQELDYVQADRLQSILLTGDPALVLRFDRTAMGTDTAWLVANGLTAPNADTLDADGDGFATWREYQAGTDPFTNRLQVATFGPLAGTSRMPLVFEAHASRTYQVISHTNLAAGVSEWTPFDWSKPGDTGWRAPSEMIAPDAPLTLIHVPVDADTPQRFYRVQEATSP